MFKTVKSKVALIYTGLVIIIVILGIVSLSNMTKIGHAIEGLISTNYNSIIRLTEMRERLLRQDQVVYSWILGDTQDVKAVFDDLSAEFDAFRQEEDGTIVIPIEKTYIEAIKFSYLNYTSLFDRMLDNSLADANWRENAFEFYHTNLKDAQASVEEQINNLFISNENAMFARQEDTAANARNSLLLLSTLFLIAAFGGYFLANLYTQRFFAPLYEITQSIKLVREGNLDSQAKVIAEDEFGMMADEFNNMTRRLAEFERNAKGSLQIERSKSDSIVKSIAEPILMLDGGGKIVLMNSEFAHLFGLEELKSEGMPIKELIPDSDMLEYIKKHEAGQSAELQSEIILVHSNEDDYFFQVVVTPIAGQDSTVSGKIYALHNVTEMKLLEKARGDFIATISHEFKTPLTSIIMGVDIISDEMLGKLNKEQHEIIYAIKEDSQRLEVLVGEMLELSKIESSKAFYSFIPCNIADVIRSSAKQFLSQAERNNIGFRLELNEDLPLVSADPSKIIWVINNLLSNAMKYTNSGGLITVEALPKDNWLTVSVADTGIGVPPEFVNVIFEKFIQVKGYDIEVRGSGVGLSVAKEIITAHGGTIWCESELMSGSKFSFSLPTI